MAKVTVHPEKTPSETIVKSANELVYVTDSRGRKLGLRKLPFLEEFRIVETVGAERATNQVYMGMLNPIIHIAEIDGEKIDIPRTHPQIEALINRAGQEGFVAAFEGISKHFAAGHKDLEARIKNADGTPD
ncbi:hypothetical protein [Zavarzinella formosa]|uniref:hypothetical protein n=1 Tax=Zavarzinella formosa TaxID=360055 RepID=UPI00031D99C0|nr:hypothetical protein [Zavarzinella formosa]